MALVQFEFYSVCLKRNVHVNAYLPFDEILAPGMSHSTKPVKTLYLLHGYTGNGYTWIGSSNNVGDISQQYNLAIIMPSGENHFYVDAENRGDMYGEFIGRELVNYTRAVFPMLSHERDDTLIGGISMGGYGAIRNGLKYSDTFGYVIGISPANIIHELADSTEEANNVGATRGFYESVFGDLSKAMESDVNPSWLAREMKKDGKPFPDIYFACGWNDMLVFTNRAFHNVLDELGVDHVYEEGPGSHEPPFFDPHLIAGISRVVPKMPDMPNPFWIEKPED